MNWNNGEYYKISLLGQWNYEGVLIDQDDTWLYMLCTGVGNKSFRKTQVTMGLH